MTQNSGSKHANKDRAMAESAMAQTDTVIAGLGRALDLVESLQEENRFLQEQLARAPFQALILEAIDNVAPTSTGDDIDNCQ